MSTIFTPVLSPPLNSTTVLSAQEPITFTLVIVSSPPVSPGASFTALLWHSTPEGKYRPSAFTPAPDLPVTLYPASEPQDARADKFVLELPAQTSLLQFCLKYRYSDGPWIWAGARIGGGDGRIVFYSPPSPSPSPPSGAQPIEVRRTRLDKMLLAKVRLECWLALIKIAAPWLGPAHGGRFLDFGGREAVMVMMLGADGRVTVAVPANGGHIKATGGDLGGGEAVVGAGDGRRWREVVARVLDTVRGGEVAGGKDTPWEEGLTYCTWNSLGWDLSEDKILSALQEFQRTGVKITNLLIDDNWQDVAGRAETSVGTLSSFSADSSKFPGGLHGLVRSVRERFPEIRYIGVWHALHGYWDGITPSPSALSSAYSTVSVPWTPITAGSASTSLTFIAPEDISRFYHQFFSTLASAGIDFVKTDVQSRFGEMGLETFYPPYLAALKAAADEIFDGRVVYSMAHHPAILLQPNTLSKRAVVRASDDFYEALGQGSHRNHIFNNAHNAILFAHMKGVRSDWDMFQSHAEMAGLHANARAVAGSWKTVTDAPGQSDNTVLAMLERWANAEGQGVVEDPWSGGRTGLVVVKREGIKGVFNCSEGERSLLIKVEEGRRVRLEDERVVNSGEMVLVRVGSGECVALEEERN